MKPRVFRSPAARVIAWVWLAVAVALLADTVIRGRDLAAFAAAGVLLFISGVAYVTGLRPCIVADDRGIKLRNLLRDILVPWQAVEKVEAADTVRVISGGRRYRAWALQVSPRKQAKEQMRARRDKGKLPDAVVDEMAGRTPVSFAAEQLSEMAETRRTGKTQAKDKSRADGKDRAGDSTSAVTVTWSVPAIAALAGPGVLVIAAGIAAMV